MDSFTYANNLAKKFGETEEHTQQIFNFLVKLIRLAKSEVGEKSEHSALPFSNNENRDMINQLKGFIKSTPEESVSAIMATSNKEYDKVILIIDTLRVMSQQYHISIIPSELFNTFWAFAENEKTGIVFSDDYQNFHLI